MSALGTMANAAIVLSLKDQFTAGLGRAQYGLTRFGQAADRAGSSLARMEARAKQAQRAGEALGNAGKTLGLSIAAGASIAAKDAVSSAAAAETSLARIALTSGKSGDAARKLMGEWRKDVIGISRETNQLQGDIATGFGTLVAAGFEPDKALNATRSSAHAALATGADINDLNKSLYASYVSLKVPVNEFSLALETMAKAGNEGNFELKAMGKAFPQLTAAGAGIGLHGRKGIASIAAALQVAMRGAGSEEEAAGNLKNFLSKLSSPETVKNFEKMGVNFRRLKREAEASADPMFYYLSTIQNLTKGDSLKLGQLFGDMQAQNYVRPLLNDLEEFRRIRNESYASRGMIQESEVLMMGTAAEQMKRLQVNTEANIQSTDTLAFSLSRLTKILKGFSDGGFDYVDLAGAGLAASGLAVAGGWGLKKFGGNRLGQVAAQQAARPAMNINQLLGMRTPPPQSASLASRALPLLGTGAAAFGIAAAAPLFVAANADKNPELIRKGRQVASARFGLPGASAVDARRTVRPTVATKVEKKVETHKAEVKVTFDNMPSGAKAVPVKNDGVKLSVQQGYAFQPG